MNRFRYIRFVLFQVSQQEFAKIAGVRQPTVSRWENGKSEPSFTQINCIRAEALRRGLPWRDAIIFEAA